MPIKFRCQHCRQFLGISRAKAGEIFDCPTCGWTLRVPDLDGTIRPLPGPGLDLEDSKLAQALDELASIDDPARVSAFRSAAQSVGGTGIEGRLIDDRNGDESESSNLESRDAAGTPDGPNNDSGLPLQRGAGLCTLDQPIELPPLPAPVPIDMQPRVRAPKLPLPVADDDSGDDSESGRARAWKSTAQAGDSWRRLLAAAEINLSEGDSTDEPVKEADPNSAAIFSDEESAANSSSLDGQGPRILVLSGPLIWAAAGAGAVVFAVGFWGGRVTTLPASSTSQEPSSSIVESGTKLPQADAPNNDVSNNDVQKGNDTAGRRSAFRGRITYQAETGERKADRGARVIVLPVERKGTAKLSTTGLRSGDQPEDQQFAATGIRTLGGDVATTNDSGEFEVKLSGSGQYYILALSNSVSRENEADAAEVEKALATYFERPAQLLGRVMHHLEVVRYSGDGVTPWDFSFRSP